MKPIVTLLGLAITMPSVSLAQAPDCSDRVVPYEQRASIKNPEYSLELAGGKLTYFGSRHASDPADPMFAEIDAAWERAKPTIAFYEGPDRPIAESREETIKATGESGYTRFLARKHGIAIGRLEPSPMDEVAYLTTKFPLEQVQLFFLLREAARLVSGREWARPRYARLWRSCSSEPRRWGS